MDENINKVVLIGHSQGGTISSMVLDELNAEANIKSSIRKLVRISVTLKKSALIPDDS